MQKYDRHTSGIECEIRGVVKNPDKLLELVEETGRYSLEDVFYFPKLYSTDTEDPQWDPKYVTLRLRNFSPVGYQVIFSIQEYTGPLKTSKKYILAEGTEDDLKKLLELLGFKPFFSIKRLSGYFLKLKDSKAQTVIKMVLENIENIGWMFEAHIEPKELNNFLKTFDISEACLLTESLPSLYYRTIVTDKL